MQILDLAKAKTEALTDAEVRAWGADAVARPADDGLLRRRPRAHNA